MEDASLDDFFAKKDKSRKKSKIKSGDGEELAKSSSSSKKEKKKDKDKINSSNSSTIKTQEKKPVDDEWNDFEEEKAVDYSGLRIHNLQKKEDVDREGEGEEEEFDENGEVKERKEGASGPWNKSSGTKTHAVVKEEEKPKPAPAPAATGKYIPPSQRAGAISSSMSSNSRRKKEALNVHSDIDFPTLAVGPGQGQLQSNNSGGQGTPNQGKGVPLENKFSVLGD